MVNVNTEECIGCGYCINECPVQAISEDGDVVKVDQMSCNTVQTGCTNCADICPEECITIDETPPDPPEPPGSGSRPCVVNCHVGAIAPKKVDNYGYFGGHWEMFIDHTICDKCIDTPTPTVMQCMLHCPTSPKSIELNENGYPVINAGRCNETGASDYHCQ